MFNRKEIFKYIYKWKLKYSRIFAVFLNYLFRGDCPLEFSSFFEACFFCWILLNIQRKTRNFLKIIFQLKIKNILLYDAVFAMHVQNKRRKRKLCFKLIVVFHQMFHQIHQILDLKSLYVQQPAQVSGDVLQNIFFFCRTTSFMISQRIRYKLFHFL